MGEHRAARTGTDVGGRPLADVTVLDLTVARAGPTAVRQLADWGADVVRIEAIDRGDGAGHTTPDYLNLHRNKRSLALDLKSPDGRGVLHRLVAQADLLVENMRPAVKHRLGFDWETVSSVNPRLIMGSISGFGQTGPSAERGGVDQIAQGMAGMMSVTGHPDHGPVRAGAAVSDIAAGLQLAVGLLVALHERQTTGRGRHVHTSLLESMLGMLDFQAARHTVAGEVPTQAGNDHPTLRPMGMYRCADGHLNIAAPWDHLWQRFCEVLGRPGLAQDPRFATNRDRLANSDELNQTIEDLLRTRTVAEWVDACNEAGIPAGPVNDIGQAFADPQVRHLEVAKPVEHVVAGPIEVIGNATTIEGHDNAITRPSPMAGQHSSELLTEFGFGENEVAELISAGVVGEWPPRRSNR